MCPRGPQTTFTPAPHPHYDRRIAARALPPLRVAVVHPALEAALASAARGLIAPTLIAPRAKIEAAAREAGADLSGIPIVDAPHDHAAANAAVAMALRGEVDASMKCSLHTDELIGAVVRREGGLIRLTASHRCTSHGD